MKKIVAVIVVVALAVVGINLFGPNLWNRKQLGKNTVTDASLQNAINIEKLSTAQFVYNGIAEKYNEEDSDDVECHIAYESVIRAGINMQDVKFKVDEKNKKVIITIPDVQIDTPEIDTGSLSYIPKNPKLQLNEIIDLCKKDAQEEGNQSEELKEVAKNSLKTTIQGLITPLLAQEEYSLEWNEASE